MAVSPDLKQGYAFSPVYSPDGTQLAYAINPGNPENPQYKLVVQDLSSGEVRELDSLVNFWGLEWSSDGKVLVYSNGPYESAQVYGYDLRRGEAVALAEAASPAWRGRRGRGVSDSAIRRFGEAEE